MEGYVLLNGADRVQRLGEVTVDGMIGQVKGGTPIEMRVGFGAK